MKYVVALALTAACGVKSTPPPKAGPPPAPALSIIGRFGMGQACPVGGRVYTAAHLLIRRAGLAEQSVAFAFSQGDIRGFLYPAMVEVRDLGVLKTHEVEPRYKKFGKPPSAGDEISWHEYNLHSPGVLSLVRRTGTITALRAGHFSFLSSDTRRGPTPYPGASGSCVEDAAGGVVGIVVWGVGRYFPEEGIAVNLTGDWKP